MPLVSGLAPAHGPVIDDDAVRVGTAGAGAPALTVDARFQRWTFVVSDAARRGRDLN